MLRLQVRQDLKNHLEIEVNGVVYIQRKELDSSVKELKTLRKNLIELTLKVLLAGDWIEYYKGESKKPEEEW